ncbi:TIGR03960 family B12-binding radical SAM protein [Treponema pectinovorum]|uniref:TIGR03960 family B12-binding radical SAM protein n=1 Tax=Treponema pectinovorum TaxID=164 RepID=UPI003D911264
MKNLINPIKVFGAKLIGVQNPATYLGGEIGEIVKNHTENDDLFNFAMAFPDTYAIGMSNQAIKIIYQGLNKKKNIRCERVFCPEKDFEQLLKETSTPLYTLETGIPLKDVDMIGFSIGYELGIIGALQILDCGKIPLLKKQRGEEHPIVIAGGVGATNPAPFSIFFDAIFIGEAEGGMFELIESLAEMKKSGATKEQMLKEFAKSPNVWTEGMSVETYGHSIARRAVYENFAEDEPLKSYFPLPNIKTVQDHGVVEIMRGCPNGCRFCHAGIYYRPQRARSKKIIFDYVEELVNKAGYKEISLTSLSSADYPDIAGLLKELNEKYRSRNISFQLPSLKVNSFTFPILDELNEVRKSGLTFAVETPDETWQLCLNKEVYAQHLEKLINEAKSHGWNKAKFYFMVGLPFFETQEKTEEKVIVDFMLELQEKTKIQCHVNVGTFIPKPHTPYQWARQISPEESEKKLRYIRENLPKGKFKVGTHDVSTSYIEALCSRGDKRAGKIIYEAYKKGIRLDAWEENLRKDLPLWEETFAEADYDVKKEILREKDKAEPLPWDDVSLGPPKSFYLKEWEKHEKKILTPICKPNCEHRCGVCNSKVAVNTDKFQEDVDKSIQKSKKSLAMTEDFFDRRQEHNIPVLYRCIFKFTKKDGVQFISHLSLIEMFNRAIQKSNLPVVYTAGFNPLPKIEFASTLSLGIESEDEITSIIMYEKVDELKVISALNAELIKTIRIEKIFIFPVTNQRKRESLSASLWGSLYEYKFYETALLDEFLKTKTAQDFFKSDSFCSFKRENNILKCILVFSKDRAFRNAIEDFSGKKLYQVASIKKIKTFAKPQITGWTKELNDEYSKKIKSKGVKVANEIFKDRVLKPEQNIPDENFVDYFELYRRIAAINLKLIEQRNSQE